MPEQLTEQKPTKDTWIKDNSLFVCDGQKYGITKDGSTVCGGSVPGATQTTPVAGKVVLQQGVKGKVLTAPEPAVVLQQKHGGGRPKKEGAVHRTTEWRREKAEQGKLL